MITKVEIEYKPKHFKGCEGRKAVANFTSKRKADEYIERFKTKHTGCLVRRFENGVLCSSF